MESLSVTSFRLKSTGVRGNIFLGGEKSHTRDVNKDLTPKDQDKDKDLTPKDQDKDKDLTPQDKDHGYTNNTNCTFSLIKRSVVNVLKFHSP